MVEVEPHPLLDAIVFESDFGRPLGEFSNLGTFSSFSMMAPIETDDQVRKSVRDLLRHGGFKPTGRNKPAPEYLLKAADGDGLPVINGAVDILNVVSLHSGLPISVVDLDLLTAPLSIKLAGDAASYEFNSSGQSIDLAGLLCLHDARGPCANAVKDSQRTKTSAATRRTLSVIWGSRELAGRTEATFQWYRSLLTDFGAKVHVLPKDDENVSF